MIPYSLNRLPAQLTWLVALLAFSQLIPTFWGSPADANPVSECIATQADCGVGCRAGEDAEVWLAGATEPNAKLVSRCGDTVVAECQAGVGAPPGACHDLRVDAKVQGTWSCTLTAGTAITARCYTHNSKKETPGLSPGLAALLLSMVLVAGYQSVSYHSRRTDKPALRG